MASRAEFLLQLWNEMINKPLSEVWFDNAIRRAAKEPNAPVADLGPVVDRLLSQGVSSRDLSLICRAAEYQAVFGLPYICWNILASMVLPLLEKKASRDLHHSQHWRRR